jgi:hypothetical protein
MSHSTVLDKIKREFGSRERLIERVFTNCPSFRTLCGDYLACSRALAGSRKSASPEACLREAEYSELLQELADEIETRLCAVESVNGLCRRVAPGAGQGLGG